MLSPNQLQCRQSDAFQAQFKLIERKEKHLAIIPSFMKYLYCNLILHLSRLWKVDECIIHYNLTRLDEITTQVIHCRKDHRQTYHLHEWSIALEIFLQIDGK